MKLYKFMLGVSGVMAFALTSCHDDPEYTPAENVETPPAYFNLSDESVIDLEDTSSDFVIHLYRADASGSLTVPVTTTITAPEGVSTEIFKIPAKVTFADGVTVADYKVEFNISDIKPLTSYMFDLNVDGESTPYFATDVTYDVSYVPWETVTSPDGDTDSELSMTGLLTRPWSVKCLVQKHPAQEGFYRVRHPYFTAPELGSSESDDIISTQRYPESNPNYLYINANNERSVYFSNSKGKAQVFYYTGYVLDKTVPDFGEELMLFCEFSAYLAKSFTFPGLDGTFDGTQGDYSSKAGAMEDGIIDFKSNMSWTYPAAADPAKGSFGYGGFDSWKLTLADAQPPIEWETIGACDYVDGFIANVFESEEPVGYKVSVERNIDVPTRIRLIMPYVPDTYPFPGDAVSNPEKYNIEINLKDPDMVLIDIQETGYIYNRTNYQICNAGAWLYYGYADGSTPMSAAEIKKQGMNDTYKDGVVTIAHPIAVFGGQGHFLWEGTPFTAGQLILPDAAANAKNLVVKTQHKPKLRSQRIPVRVSLSPVKPLTYTKAAN